jgi:glutaryl-CoA dehydrogenase
MEIHMATATARKPSVPKQLPPPNSDFYRFAETLSADEQAILKKVRAYMESKVAPIINKYWIEELSRSNCFRPSRSSTSAASASRGTAAPAGSQLLVGLVGLEMARVDVPIATYFGVHSHLAMGSIAIAGSEEQKQKWLPPMARMEKIGCSA